MLASADEYILEFDFNGASPNVGSSQTTTLQLKDEDNNVLFHLESVGNWSAACTNTIYESSSKANTFGSWTGTGKLKDSRTDNSFTSLVHFIITADATNGVKLDVTSEGSSIFESGAVTLSATYKVIGSLALTIPKNNTVMGFDDFIIRTYSETEVVPTPTASVTGVSGASRFVTLSLGSGSKDGTTLAYSMNSDMSEPTTYSTPFEVSSTSTVYFQATSPTSAVSSIESIEVTCGEITLNAPTYTINSYTDGVTSVTLSSNQSDKLLAPTADITYTINDGTETTVANGSSINLNTGDVIVFWATKTGYTASSKVYKTVTAGNTKPLLWTETYYSSDNSAGVTRDADAGVVVTVNTSNYYYMLAGGSRISNRLVTSSNKEDNDYWLYRNGGLYSGKAKAYAILGVNTGDYVVITYSKGDGDPTPTATDGAKDEWNSTSTSAAINVTGSTGVLRFTIARYGYIKSITVYRALATPGATVGSTGFATFAADVALDLSTLTSGFTAYFASSAADGKVNMTKATDEKIAAGEGLFIQKTGDANTFTITETREATDDVDNYLVAGDGVTGGVTKEDGYDKYVLGADGGSVSFFLVNETAATVPANKAYLKLPAGDPSARLTISFGEETTGISFRNVETTGNERFYNLQGQPVAAPTKGLYIVRSAEGRLQGKNGKKVIVK